MTAEGPEPPAPAGNRPDWDVAWPDARGQDPAGADARGQDPAGPGAGDDDAVAPVTGGPDVGGAPDAAEAVAEGTAFLDQAIAAFSRACQSADADVFPLAVELLARTLPLRGRDADAAQAWQEGLDDPDPAVGAAVRARLRRAFGGDEVLAAGQAPPTWWEGFVEAAVCHGTLPLLANELFGALDQMYSLAAVPLAQGGGRARDLREALLSAVRVPSQYAWGPELHDSFRQRLREAMGAATDVLPPTWPDD